MSKTRLLLIMLIGVALEVVATHLPAFSGLDTSGVQRDWTLAEAGASGGVWWVTLAGVIALLLSGPVMARVVLMIVAINNLLALFGALTYSVAVRELSKAQGHDVVGRPLAHYALAFATVVVLFGIGKAYKSVGTWVRPKKGERPTSQNPWTAIDRGDDPTL
jgi:hypothetical protein